MNTEKVKTKIKKKYGTIVRFAKAHNLDIHELRKTFARIESNNDKYETGFNAKESLENIKNKI